VFSSQQGRSQDAGIVAEFGAYLASPEAGWISGQTFQVRGGTLEHVGAWKVDSTLERFDRGFTAGDYAHEIPRLFGAAAKRADPPPPEWSARRDTRDQRP